MADEWQRSQWASLELRFLVAGEEGTPTHFVHVPLYDGDDLLEAVEQAGRWLVNGFAKDAARRVAERVA